MLVMVFIAAILFIVFMLTITHDEMIATIAFIMCVLFGFCVSHFIGSYLPQKEVVTEQEICAINDDTMEYLKICQSEGSTEQTYQYMIKTENGKTMKEIAVKDVIIGENDIPVIRKHEYVFTEEWHYLIAIGDYKGDYIEILLPKDAKIY